MTKSAAKAVAPPAAQPSVAPKVAQARAAEVGAQTTALITMTVKSGPVAGACGWHLGKAVGLSESDRAALAWIVAEAIMERRSGDADAVSIWRRAALDGSRLTGKDKLKVEAFVHGVFGLPPRGASEDHLTGHVAEWLWYLNATEIVRPERSIELLDPPKFNVTEPGADGFIVFSDTNTGEMGFRLWEIKKHDGSSDVSGTIRVAYDQVETKALRYLAQQTSVHSALPGPVGDLCKELVDLWIDHDGRAGVGVGVASASTRERRRCFSTMGARFPNFDQPGQLEGLLLAVENLTGLARLVREYLWIVL